MDRLMEPVALDAAEIRDPGERGRIVEDGTHDQLVKSGGRYATLHSIQAGLTQRRHIGHPGVRRSAA